MGKFCLSLSVIMLWSCAGFCQCICPKLASSPLTCMTYGCKMTVHVAYCSSNDTSCYACYDNVELAACCAIYETEAGTAGLPCGQRPAQFTPTDQHDTLLVASACLGSIPSSVLAGGPTKLTRQPKQQKAPEVRRSSPAGVGHGR